MMSDESTVDKAGPQQEDRKEDAGKPLNPFQRNLEAFISHIDSLNGHGTQAMVVIGQSHKQANPLVQELLKTEPSPVESEEDAFTIPEDKLTKFRRLQCKIDHGSRLSVGSGRPWNVRAAAAFHRVPLRFRSSRSPKSAPFDGGSAALAFGR